jgi:hypothetical protein
VIQGTGLLTRYNEIITDLCGPIKLILSETLIVLRGGDRLPLAKMDLVLAVQDFCENE